MNLKKLMQTAAVAFAISVPMAASASHERIMITPTLESVVVMHHGKKVTIERVGEKDHLIPAPYNKTSRACPPFCVQPIEVVPGVETIGELELLEILKRISSGDKSYLVVDSRTPDWIARGTIPGSVNVPWNQISVENMGGMFETDEEERRFNDIMTKQFGAKKTGAGWDFSEAKTLALFCNGLWCPQSSINIKTLVKLGYPVSKLKWYRGGMQDWVTLGFTTVKK